MDPVKTWDFGGWVELLNVAGITYIDQTLRIPTPAEPDPVPIAKSA